MRHKELHKVFAAFARGPHQGRAAKIVPARGIEVRVAHAVFNALSVSCANSMDEGIGIGHQSFKCFLFCMIFNLNDLTPCVAFQRRDVEVLIVVAKGAT